MKKLTKIFILAIFLFSIQVEAVQYIEGYCVCYLPNGKLEGAAPENKTLYDNCLPIVEKEFDNYSLRDRYLNFPTYMNVNQIQEKNKDTVCSKEALKDWEKNYKNEQKEDIVETKLKIQKKKCGLAEDKLEGDSQTVKCANDLISNVDEKVVTSIKDECTESKLNTSKKTRKNCVELEKALFVLNGETSSGVVMEIPKFLADPCLDEAKYPKSRDRRKCIREAKKEKKEEDKKNKDLAASKAKISSGEQEEIRSKYKSEDINLSDDDSDFAGTMDIPKFLADPCLDEAKYPKNRDRRKCIREARKEKKEDEKKNKELNASKAKISAGELENIRTKYKSQDINLSDLGEELESTDGGGTLEILHIDVTPPIVVKFSSSTGDEEIKEEDADKPEAFTKGHLKEFLSDGKFAIVTKEERKACLKAYVRGRKQMPMTTSETAFKFLEDNNCPINKIMEGTNDGGVCLKKALTLPDAASPISKDEYFYSRYKSVCEKNAPEKDQDGVLNCYAEVRSKPKPKDQFLVCTDKLGITAKYGLKSFGQSLKDEFKVSGCDTERKAYDDAIAATTVEKEAKAKADKIISPMEKAEQKLNMCVARRVGQEAANAILAELTNDGIYRLLKDKCDKETDEAKKKTCLDKLKNTSNLVSTLAAFGMDTAACIPPRTARANGDKPFTRSEQFCDLLDPRLGGDNSGATEYRKTVCLQKVKECDNPPTTGTLGKNEYFAACGNSVVNCVREGYGASSGLSSPSFNYDSCKTKGIADYMLSVNDGRTFSTVNMNTASCLGGAIASGIAAFTSTLCANEIKYPTSQAKDDCLKRMRTVNQVSKIAGDAVGCLNQLPGMATKDSYAGMSAEEKANFSTASNGLGFHVDNSPQAQTQKQKYLLCTTKALGDGAIDMIADRICENKATQAEKDKCRRAAGVAKVAASSAYQFANCEITNNSPYPSTTVGADLDLATAQRSKDHNVCLARAAGDAAMGLLKSDAAAELACKKKKDNEADFNKCKDRYRQGVSVASTGLKLAGGIARCETMAQNPRNTPQQQQAEKALCMMSESFNAMGEMPGKVTIGGKEVDLAKLKTIAEVGKIGLAAVSVFNSIGQCPPGDQVCVATILSNQIPGDGKIYASFALQGYSLIKQKNPCKVPSKFLSKASSLVKLGGDLVSQAIHKVETDRMKKEYPDLMREQETSNTGSDLYSNMKGIIDRNNQARNAERGAEGEAVVETQQFSTSAAANDAQLRGITFQRKNEEIVLKTSIAQAGFLYTSTLLNTAATTYSVFEAFAEQTAAIQAPILYASQQKNMLSRAVANAMYGVAKSRVAAGLAAQTVTPANAETATWIATESKSSKEIAPWYECELFGGEKKSAGTYKEGFKAPLDATPLDTGIFLKNNKVNIAAVNNAFDGLNDHQAMVVYEDYDRYINGELQSISLDEYEEMGNIGFNKNSYSLADTLKIAANYIFNVAPVANAMDLSVLENVGVSLANGLWPGTGGFGGGSKVNPMGYAEDVTFLFVKKGLDYACAADKKGPDGKCQYTGKATIEFAARKLTHTVLKEVQKKNNNIMNTGLGRIVIAGYGAYKLGELIVENQKIIEAQKSRVETLKSTEADFLEQTGSYDYHKKIKKMFDQFIFSDAYAKVNNDPDNIKFCINKKMDMDFKCSCRQKGCYETFPNRDQNFKSHIGALSSKFGNTFNQGMGAANIAANMTNQILVGSRGSSDINVEELNLASQKLLKFNKSLLGAYNKFREKSGRGKIDFDKQIAAYDKRLFSSLPPAVVRGLANVHVASLKPQPIIDNSPPKVEVEDPKEEESVTTISDLPAVIATEEKVEEVAVAKTDEEIHQAMNKTYEYNKHDIDFDKEASLFKKISGRYHKKKDHLKKHD